MMTLKNIDKSMDKVTYINKTQAFRNKLFGILPLESYSVMFIRTEKSFTFVKK